MIEGWSDFYLLIGSGAAALIGLLFVVTTLTAGRDRSEVQRGMRLYTSPIVFHLALVLLLSGAGMAPALSPQGFGILCALSGGAGAAAGVRIAIGIRHSDHENVAGWFDVAWYGIVPALLYASLLGFGAALVTECRWGAPGVAASLMGLLLVAIHNAWDLVTWLAPKADGGGASDENSAG
jgi:hypothetical protein